MLLLTTRFHLEGEQKGLLQSLSIEAAHPTSPCNLFPLLLVQESRQRLSSGYTSPRLQDSPATKSALFSVRWCSHPWPSSLPLPRMPGQSWAGGTSPCAAQTDTSSCAQALGISPHLPGPVELAANGGLKLKSLFREERKKKKGYKHKTF